MLEARGKNVWGLSAYKLLSKTKEVKNKLRLLKIKTLVDIKDIRINFNKTLDVSSYKQTNI